jgi:hypothetical protein
MAFLSFLIGSIAGLVAMLVSVLAYDASVASSLVLWFVTGSTVSLYTLAATYRPQPGMFGSQPNGA